MAIKQSTKRWIGDFQQWLTKEQSMNNAQMVADHFGQDWSPEAIAALCGNMRHESSINPQMYEYGWSWSQDRGYGLVQWTPRSKYWDWAESQGLTPESGDSQLARIDYEVEKNIQWIPISRFYGMTFAEFRSNAENWSVDYLTEAFCWSYERPNAEAGEASMPDRKAFAREALATLDFTGNGGGGGDKPTPSKAAPAAQYQYEKEGTWEDMTYYKVKAGDSLSAIAKKFGVNMNGIKRVKFQDIPNKNAIDKNEILLLPKASTKKAPVVAKPVATYTVRSGDTLSAIAKKFNLSTSSLAKKNGIQNPDLIKVGQRLKL